MGVKGLWTLLEPAGYPISLESLEGKIIAVDISIWINQSIKGIRDKRGILAENAHLLGLFSRICKLLFYKIKPVFVFDGGAPALKRQTIEERRLRRENILAKAKTNVNKVLKSYLSDKLQKDIEFDEQDEEGLLDVEIGLKEWTAKDDGFLFVLPDDSPEKKKDQEKSQEDQDWQEFAFSAHVNLRHIQDTSLIDTESEDFKSLPPEIRHELLAEIREKKRRLNKVEDIPTETGDFSDYQMQRILVRRKIQEKMEQVQGEMVASISNKAASNFPVNASSAYEGITASRVMSDDSTHFIYLNKRRLEKEDGPSKLLMPKRRKEEPERDFCPKTAYRDIFASVEDFDFGIKEEAQKDGASSLKEKVKQEIPNGPTLKFELKPVKPKFVKVFNLPEAGSLIHSESESETDNDNDFLEVEEIQVSDDETSDHVKSTSQKSVSIDQPSTANYQKEPDLVDESSSSTIDADLEPSTSFDRSKNVTQKGQTFINFDEPVASTSKEADRIESRMAELSTRSPSDSNKSFQPSPPTASKKTFSNVRTGILSDIVKRKEKLSRDDEETLDSDDSWSDLVIEKEVQIPAKKPRPSDDVEIINESEEESVIIKSHHFTGMTTTPIQTPTKTFSSQASPFKSAKISPTIHKTPTTPTTPTTPKTPMKNTPTKPTNSSSIVSPIKVLRSSERSGELDEQLREMKKAERQTSTVAQNMISDCRELLSMFGIPYVMSPMEAEAQCAALEIQGLTHGTITDDSDVWLFGGKTVFKNFFNQSKFVEMYRIDDIEKKLKLDRDTMICVAMLTGCDYTDGVEGVGPVRATEILSEFPGKGIERLRAFKDWWSSKKKGDKSPGNKLRSQLLKLNLSDNFPSDLVYKAFMSPIVLESSESFSWGMPDLDLLRQYAGDKMRWSKEKIDTTLLPIIKKLNEKQNQLRIDQFIKLRSNNNKMAYASKRLANAVNKMSGLNESTVEVAIGDKQGMSKLREKVKNQRKKGRPINQRNQSNNNNKKPIKSTKAKNPKKSDKKGEHETVQLSETSSEED